MSTVKTRIFLKTHENGASQYRSVVITGTAAENKKILDDASSTEKIHFKKSDQQDRETDAYFEKNEIVSLEDFITG